MLGCKVSTEAGGAQWRLKTSIKAVLSLGDAFYELRKIKHISNLFKTAQIKKLAPSDSSHPTTAS
ncbi:hypothetical protein LPIBR_50179 [Lacticaseibacillus paracasei]|nr:hypothetical protein LPIBR_50179 [Lacticaseibacillus paracasei]